MNLFLVEGYSTRFPVEQFGISTNSVQRWAKAFQLKGAEGLASKYPASGKRRVADEVRQQAVASHCLPCKEDVAGHLQYLFDRFDPAFFCKRDSDGNLNHVAVNQVQEKAPQSIVRPKGHLKMVPSNTHGEFRSYSF